jgi:hypothetical protein
MRELVMMRRFAIFAISMLSNISLYSADTLLYQSSDAAEPAAAPTVTQDPDLFNKFEVSGFFGRQRKKKLLEGFEHCYKTDELVFLLATDPSAEPTINPSTFANVKTFAMGLQQAIAEQLTIEIKTPQIRDTLRHISKHALYFCRTCCELELKKRKAPDMQFGKIWAENPLKFWPCSWERVDAATFYKACAYDTTFYSKKSDGELSALLDATK